MARLKNISGAAREVPLLSSPLMGELVRAELVEADEIVEIPDEIFRQFAWPETNWQVTKPPAKPAELAEEAAEPEEGEGE